jgi:DNA-binding transcriptional LysR family regulator
VDALAAATLYLSDAAGDFVGLVQAYVERGGFRAAHLQSAGSVEGVKRGVLADADALGILPAYAVADEVARGTFAAITPDPPLPPVWLSAVWPQGADPSPRASAIADRLREIDLSGAGE